MTKQNLKDNYQVYIRLSEEDRNILREMSQESGINPPQILRIIIHEFINSGKRIKFVIE